MMCKTEGDFFTAAELAVLAELAEFNDSERWAVAELAGLTALAEFVRTLNARGALGWADGMPDT